MGHNLFDRPFLFDEGIHPNLQFRRCGNLLMSTHVRDALSKHYEHNVYMSFLLWLVSWVVTCEESYQDCVTDLKGWRIIAPDEHMVLDGFGSFDFLCAIGTKLLRNPEWLWTERNRMSEANPLCPPGVELTIWPSLEAMWYNVLTIVIAHTKSVYTWRREIHNNWCSLEEVWTQVRKWTLPAFGNGVYILSTWMEQFRRKLEECFISLHSI